MPEVVLTVKSSPDKANAFSFIWRVTASGWHCDRVGPSGGLKAVSGAMIQYAPLLKAATLLLAEYV